jgi:glycosyltransferase involved in cell wall biosynthesis
MGKAILYIGNKLSRSKKNPTTHEALEQGLKAEGFTIYSASHLQNKYLRLVDMLWCFFRNYRKVDFVLIDVYSTQNFWYALAIARMSKAFSKKYIPILHGGNLEKRFKDSPAKSAHLLKNAHCIICPSPYLKGQVEKLGYSGVHYISNPLFLTEYTFKPRANLKPKLLWVRAFDRIYNPLLALKSLEILIKYHPEAQLCMVGPDKDGSMETCRKYAEKHKLPIRFTGKLKKKEWIALAENFDIFINTTDIDNTPVSVIEAMALGISVVSTEVGGIPFLIENDRSGLLVPPNDPVKMADSVMKLLGNPLQALEMSRCAREKTTNFDWPVIKHEWSKVLG